MDCILHLGSVVSYAMVWGFSYAKSLARQKPKVTRKAKKRIDKYFKRLQGIVYLCLLWWWTQTHNFEILQVLMIWTQSYYVFDTWKEPNHLPLNIVYLTLSTYLGGYIQSPVPVDSISAQWGLSLYELGCLGWDVWKS